MSNLRREDALAYHRNGRPGKIEVVPTKPVNSQLDLSLAYSPGVAEPCREIARDPSTVDLYTARANLVAVVTNGTAVLGLGNLGPLAAKPVMEGKAILFKRYADIDVFDIEVNETDPDRFVEVVAALEPTFGGINLEDVKAPECFIIERKLRERMKIPVFHDDQHGTAIISGAALVNAAEIQKHALPDMRVVCFGAGAAAIACMQLWVRLGVKKENIALIDSKGVVRKDRPGALDPERADFALPDSDPRRTVMDAMTGAHAMCGLASGGIVTKDMVRAMAPRPIILAMANPDPEIPYDDAKEARPDAIVGTGRSDYPNQVNNVLGFPFIFRGALDVGAQSINEEMKLAASRALAALAREGVPEHVLEAYGGGSIKFGPDYIIPKPVDTRVLSWVAPAVAKAAMDSGNARRKVDIEQYRESLTQRLSPTRRVMWKITSAAKKAPKRIVFPEGEELKILHAARIVADEGIAKPILIGRNAVIAEHCRELGLDLTGIEVVDRNALPHLEEYAELLWQKRQRRGLSRTAALAAMRNSRTYYGMAMLESGHADGLIAGLSASYADTIRPALQVIGVREGVKRAAGLYMIIGRHGARFFADTSINIDPDAETVAEIATMSADLVSELGIEPRVAMLSFSNFGDAPHPESRKMAEATAMVAKRRPELMIDGEMQADVALIDSLREAYPFSKLTKPANVLVFPNLAASNIAYKLLSAIDGFEVIGPIVLGIRKPVNVLQPSASVSSIVHLTAITVARATV
jgi:malate dehydrogenase (oxaloacetate-decarboxylating)(NADP+)